MNIITDLQIYLYLCNMKLSVVIPVYQVEQTLNRCVESVRCQDVQDMEVILVDDGSPDRCPQLCDEWAAKDTRIQVIHKPNGGLSDARNAGIDIATGEYITFVDSDDYLSPDTYQPLLQKLTEHPEYDIMEYPVADSLPLCERTYHDMGEYWLDCKAYLHTYACNKIYRRELFQDIRYPKGRLFEDAYTFPLLLQATKVLATTNVGLYHYCYNPDGITAQADGKALAMLLQAHLQSSMHMNDDYYLHLANIQSDVWERTKDTILLPERQVDIRRLHGKNKLKAITLNLLGIKTLCRINKVIHLFVKPSRS